MARPNAPLPLLPIDVMRRFFPNATEGGRGFYIPDPYRPAMGTKFPQRYIEVDRTLGLYWLDTVGGIRWDRPDGKLGELLQYALGWTAERAKSELGGLLTKKQAEVAALKAKWAPTPAATPVAVSRPRSKAEVAAEAARAEEAGEAQDWDSFFALEVEKAARMEAHVGLSPAEMGALDDALYDVVCHFRGRHNVRRSRGHQIKWGTRGSLSVDLDKALWCDHEAQGVGGKTVAFVMHEANLSREEAFEWLKRSGLVKTKA